MAVRDINDTSKTIETTNTKIIEEVFGRNRLVMTLRNTSTAGEIIYISMGQEAKIGEGIQLKQGDVYSTSAEAGYIPPSVRINAIATANTATIAIHEELGEVIE